MRKVASWLLRWGPNIVAALVVLALFAGVCWTMIVVDDGPWWWAAIIIAVSVPVAAKGLLIASEL